MIFNSLTFLVFLVVTFFVHWAFFRRNVKTQNFLLLIASIFFYGFWNLKLLILLLGLGTFSYFVGISLTNEQENENKRRALFFLHLLVSIFTLCIFKYFNFFVGELKHNTGNTSIDFKLIFPLGLSFYTFSNISYIFDIYKGKLDASKNWLDYILYVAFFPKIVSGPIEKPGPFLEQLKLKRNFSYESGINSLRLLVLGFFKKIVVADSISPFVDNVFVSPHSYNAPILIGIAFLYAFQIYADFSGYSDIAKGVAGLFGIEIMTNFEFPFFSKNIGEFWRRWHISLSTWLNDYVFKPTAILFRNLGNHGIYLGILTTFFISGIWHGEGLTFLIWGMLHALYYIPVIYGGNGFSGITSGQNSEQKIKLVHIPSILLTFCLFTFALIFFRADNLKIAVEYISHLGKFKVIHAKKLLATNTESIQMAKCIVGIFFLLLIDIILFRGKKIPNFLYYILFVVILFLGSYSKSMNFIYFKF